MVKSLWDIQCITILSTLFENFKEVVFLFFRKITENLSKNKKTCHKRGFC